MKSEKNEEESGFVMPDRYAVVISVFDQITDETLLRIGVSRLTANGVKEFVGGVWPAELRSSQLEKREWEAFVGKLQDGQENRT